MTHFKPEGLMNEREILAYVALISWMILACVELIFPHDPFHFKELPKNQIFECGDYWVYVGCDQRCFKSCEV